MPDLSKRRVWIAMPALVSVLLLLAACGSDDVGDVSSTSLEGPTLQAEPAGDAVTTDAPTMPEVKPPEIVLEAPEEVSKELKIIWEAWALLTQDYVDRDKLDPALLSEAAVRGMLDALDDPHTHYVAPQTFSSESQDILRGKFEGIGAHVSINRAGKILIVAPIEGSPAEAAGLRPGDVILAVDGDSIEGFSLLEAVALIRGPRGSTVRLLILHLGALDPLEIDVIRGVIPLVSVIQRSDPGDKIAHIRLTNFFPETADELVEEINEAVASGAEALVLDVRDNLGGLLNSVVDVASQFLDDGLVLYEIDGAGRRSDWRVRPSGAVRDLPMVVLVNEFSASASEVLVGALQDHARATVIGATTFGKGSVNIMRPLSNGGAVNITSARWYTPSGRQIQGVGLDPDIEVVARDRTDADVLQLQKAFEVLESSISSTQEPVDIAS